VAMSRLPAVATTVVDPLRVASIVSDDFRIFTARFSDVDVGARLQDAIRGVAYLS